MGEHKGKLRGLHTNIRLTPEVHKRLNTLLREFPEKYENISHVFRCAIMRLYFSQVDPITDKRKKPMQVYEE